MTARASLPYIFIVSLAAAAASACSSSAATDAPDTGAAARIAAGRTGPADDAGAMVDLQSSEKWINPSCRWLRAEAYVVPSPNEESLYRAASQMGYIDLTETGQQYHLNRMAPVFNVKLTDRGKETSATCGPTSKATSFGVPVSARRFGSGRFVKQETHRTVYEVDYTWVPTPVGDQVMIALSGHMAVQVGEYRTKVYMRKMRGVSPATGANGWMVDAIDERGAQKLR